MTLVPQVVDAVTIPVIAAGGIADRQRNGGDHDAGSGRCADGNTVCGRKRIDRTPEL